MATEVCLMCDIKMLHAEKWKLPERNVWATTPQCSSQSELAVKYLYEIWRVKHLKYFRVTLYDARVKKTKKKTNIHIEVILDLKQAVLAAVFKGPHI